MLLLMCKEAADPVISSLISRKKADWCLRKERNRSQGYMSFCDWGSSQFKAEISSTLCTAGGFSIIGSDVWCRYTVCSSLQISHFYRQETVS